MTTDVQTAIIGGGIVGASVLYWLAKLGVTDTVLIERRELTSGSTWHAAGNTTYFGPYPAMTSLFAGSIRTYQMAEAESGQSIGFHQTGSLRLAATEKELAQFHSFKDRYKDFAEDLFPPEIERLMPHLERVFERMPAFAAAGIKTRNSGRWMAYLKTSPKTCFPLKSTG